MHICLASDNNYAKYVAVTMVSVLENHRDIPVTFYILDGGFSAENRKLIRDLQSSYSNLEIRFFSMDSDKFEGFRSFSHISHATYYRYIIPEICQEDKILYLDCDLVVDGSIRELWAEDIDDYYLGAVQDPEGPDEGYVNAGVMLLNLKKWRDDHIEAQLFEKTAKLEGTEYFGDQDVINSVCKGKIKLLDIKYNFMRYPEKNLKKYYAGFNGVPIIVHYIGRYKPWNSLKKRSFSGLYFKYLRKLSLRLWFKTKLALYGKAFFGLIYSKKAKYTRKKMQIKIFGIPVYRHDL